MIDIHSHILPGIDDGSDSLEESIEMLRMAAASGTTDIVATPHANLEFTFDAGVVADKIAELQAAAGDLPRIHRGCDFHLTPENIEDALRNPGKYSINHCGYLLVEFADTFIPKSTGEIFAAMNQAGLHPIITHPERNPLLRKRLDDLANWVDRGCFVQVTGQSLLGDFGSRAREVSHTLMARRLVHFLASDAHDLKHRTTALRPVWDYTRQNFGLETAEQLLIDNPKAALHGAPLAPSRTPAKKWFSFLSKRESAVRLRHR